MAEHYAAHEFTVNFSGLDLFEGVSDDEFLTIAESEPRFISKVGVDGTVTRSDVKTVITQVSVILMATSPVNDLLSAIHTLDKLTAGGAGVAPFFAKNRLGTSLIAAPEAWIMKLPDESRGKEVGTVTWEFELANAERHVGS
jgi:hypothetical protein